MIVEQCALMHFFFLKPERVLVEAGNLIRTKARENLSLDSHPNV